MKYPFPLVVYIGYKENKFYVISNDFFDRYLTKKNKHYNF